MGLTISKLFVQLVVWIADRLSLSVWLGKIITLVDSLGVTPALTVWLCEFGSLESMLLGDVWLALGIFCILSTAGTFANKAC